MTVYYSKGGTIGSPLDFHTPSNWNDAPGGGGTDATSLSGHDLILQANDYYEVTADATIGSLATEADSHLTGASGFTIYANGKDGSNYTYNLDGTLDNDNALNLSVTYAGATNLDVEPQTANYLRNLTLSHASLVATLQSQLVVKDKINIINGELNCGSVNIASELANLEIHKTNSAAKLDYGTNTVTCGRLGESNGGVGKIEGTGAAIAGTGGKIIVQKTGNLRIIDLGATAVFTGTVVIEYNGNQSSGVASQDLRASSGTYDLIVNCDNTTDTCLANASPNGINDILITKGIFDPNSSALTVAGTIEIGPDSGAADQAKFNAGASDCTIGSGKTDGAALHVRQGGTADLGSGTHTIGSIVVDNNAAAKFTNTSDTTTLNGHSNDNTRIINIGGSSICVAAGTMDVTYASGGNLQISNQAGVNNLTLTGNATYRLWGNSLITGKLTITASTTLDTQTSSSSGTFRNLTVAEGTHVDGILTCNSSTMNLGIAYSNATPSLYIASGGVFNGGTGTHNIGNFQMISSTATFSTGTTTLSTRNASSYGVFYRNGGTFNHTGGKVVITDTGNDPRILMRNDTTFYAIEIDIGTRTLSTFTWGEEYTLTISGDQDLGGGEEIGLYIKAGTFDTDNNGTEELDLTVTKEVRVGDATGSANTAILDGDAGNMSFGSVIIKSDGKYIATSATTLITSGAHSGTWGLQNGGTFDANGGTIKVTSSESTVHIQGDTFNNITVTMGSSSNSTKFRDNSAGTVTIEGALLLEEGKFFRDNPADGLQVNGNVTTEIGSTLGHLGDTGTNDLRGDLTIASGSTCILSQNTTKVIGQLTLSGSFNANGGTLKLENTSEKTHVVANGTTFANLQKTTTETCSFATNAQLVITDSLTINSSCNFKTRNGNQFTFGDTSTICTITNNGTFCNRNGSNTVTFQGASALKPFLFDGPNDFGWGTDGGSGDLQYYNLSNCNWNPDIDTSLLDSGYVKITLTGDCEFDAVTVGANSIFDFNGNRGEFSGTFDATTAAHSTGIVWDSSMAVFKGALDLNGRIPGSDANTVVIHDPPSASEKAITSFYSDGTFFAQGVESEVTGYGWTSATPGQYPAKVVVGGLFDCQQNVQCKNMVVAYDASASLGKLNGIDRTITIEEDLYMSGGIIGYSALDFDGTSECLVSDHSDFDGYSNATYMGWYKIDDVSADANFMGQSSSFSLQVIENSTNKPRMSLYDSGGGSWVDLEGNTTITVDNKWHHIAFVMDGSNNLMSIYIDGKLDAQQAWTGTLNGSSADIFIGGYRVGNVKGFRGFLGCASIWNVALTAAQIRTKMFSKFADLDSNTGCKGWWQFDEGSGGNGDTTASSVGSHPATLGPAGNAPNWAGPATFDDGTGTIDFTGTGEWAVSDYTTDYNNVKVAASTKTTTLRSVGGSEKRPRINKLLTHGGGTFTDIGNADITFYGTGSHTAGADFSGLYITYWPSSTDIPGGTYQYLITQHNDLSCTANINCGGYFAISSNDGFDLKTHTLTTGRMITYQNSTFTMGAGSLIFDSTSGLTGDYTGRTFTAGPGAIISGVAAKSGFFSENNYSVVGNITNLDVTNEELTVLGNVTNCTGDIHRWNPTIDTGQMLDADTADDRDVRLGSDLDRNTELVT